MFPSVQDDLRHVIDVLCVMRLMVSVPSCEDSLFLDWK